MYAGFIYYLKTDGWFCGGGGGGDSTGGVLQGGWVFTTTVMLLCMAPCDRSLS